MSTTAGIGETRGPLLVVHDLDRTPVLDGVTTCDAEEYLEGEGEVLAPDLTVVNLCRSYEYLSNGYYVSLLADARRQRVLPALDDIEEATHPFAYMRSLRASGLRTIDFAVVGARARVLPELMVPGVKPGTGPTGRRPVRLSEKRPQRGARYAEADAVYEDVLSVMGRTRDPRFRRLCAAVFRVLQFPLLHIRVFRDGEVWKVGQIAPAQLDCLSDEALTLLRSAVTDLPRLRQPTLPAAAGRSSIACLWDANDPFAASDEDALRAFARAAERRDLLFEVIGPRDIGRLAEHDALLIRTVTAVDSVSFQFAQTAESLGMPVIDDTRSILRCSNKVYLYELARKHAVPALRTAIVTRKTDPEELYELGFPVVLKVPDGSFSAAVERADDPDALGERLAEMLAKTPLLIAQEYTPTEFDWRVGVLEGHVIYVCKYFMARGHWQIARHYGAGRSRSGRVEAVAIDTAPDAVKSLALDSTALIGNGLYGVDIKDSADGPVLVEVNDNPSIERGYEDSAEGDRLYDAIVDCFVRRIEQASRVPRGAADER